MLAQGGQCMDLVVYVGACRHPVGIGLRVADSRPANGVRMPGYKNPPPVSAHPLPSQEKWMSLSGTGAGFCFEVR